MYVMFSAPMVLAGAGSMQPGLDMGQTAKAFQSPSGENTTREENYLKLLEL